MGLAGWTGAFFPVTQWPELVEYGQMVTILGAILGILAGLILGSLIWVTLPVALPLSAAALTYLYTHSAELHWPTAFSMSVIAAVLSIFLMMLIRRI